MSAEDRSPGQMLCASSGTPHAIWVAEPDQLALHPPVPHAGLSVAMRITSFRIAAAVDGRPVRGALEDRERS
jgi:hypothetical protein